MKTLQRTTLLFLVLALGLFIGCEKNTPSMKATNCFKATVIADPCPYIVQLEGTDIGETWRGKKNCVVVSNLPTEYQKVGSTFYFTSYGPGSSPGCTANITWDWPKAVELFDYSKSCSD